MKKIIPSLIFTAATVAGTILYIKKKFKEKNEIKLIEIEEKIREDEPKQYSSQWNAPKDEITEKITEVTNTIDTIVDGFKEEIQSVQKENDMEKETDSTQQEESEIIIESEEPIVAEEKQEEVSDVNPVEEDLRQEETAEEEIHNNDEQTEEVSSFFSDEDSAEPEIEEPLPDLQEKQTSEEDQRINDEINSIIDEIIQPQDQEDEEEITIDNIDVQEEVADEEEDTKEIEKVLNDDIPQLNPLEYADDTLKIVNENKRDENLIDDIISSIDEEDQNQQAMNDIEQLVEDEVATVKEEDLTDEELVEKYSQQFQPITAKKIGLILKQVRLMQQSIGDCSGITLLHYVIFDNEEEKNKYAEIAKIEGYEIEEGGNPNELHLINTLENNRLTLNHAILDLARNVGEFNGSYRGWAVKSTH